MSDENNGGSDPEPAEDNKKARTYGVFSEQALDLSGDAKEIVEQLKAFLPKGQTSLTVLVRLGKIVAGTPREGVTNFGQVRELDGDYEVIADNSRNEFKNVKTKKETTVSIG